MILAIDTATRWTGLALHDGTAVVAEFGWRSNQTQTIELAPTIDDLLARTGVAAADLRALAVASGPGSYTGLRVGLALAKGLALANQTPLIGVPTLEIVATAVGPLTGYLVVVIEAGRNRLWAGRYHWEADHWAASERPLITNWEALLEELDTATTFAGDISVEASKAIRRHKNSFYRVSPAASVRRAGYLAEIGWRRLRKGQVDDPASLVPTYLRDPAGN